MRIKLSIILALLIGNMALGRVTTISGNAPMHTNKEMTVFSVVDFLTKTKNTITKVKVSDQGAFSVDINIENTTYILLDFGKIKRYLYIEPSNEYKVVIDNISEKILSSESIYATDEQPANIINKDSTDINELLGRIESEIALFTLKNKFILLNSSNTDSIDAFAKMINRKYPVNKSNFFSLYVEYSIAKLYQLAYKANKDYFVQAFLLNKAVYADHPAYMKIFQNHFQNYLMQVPEVGFKEKIFNYINRNEYDALMTRIFIAGETYGNQFKELLLLNIFYENYGHPELKPEMVKSLITKIMQTSRSASNRMAATNILRRIMELTPGADAPDFALYDLDSNIIQLSNYKGKYVYLCFGETWSRAFEMDIKMMKKWVGNYPEMEIITVIVDEDPLAYEAFIVQHQPTWTILHAGLVPAITLDYKIKNYPSYFLIGPDGKLVFSPAKSPYEGFENQFSNFQQN